jgi:hypothetical protein
MTDDEKKQKRREKQAERRRNKRPWECAGKDIFGCTLHVQINGFMCGRCKGKYSFIRTETRRATIPTEERRAFIEGTKKTRAEIRMNERAYYLNRGPSKTKNNYKLK